MRASSIGVLVFVVACGGKLDTGDAGEPGGADASAKLDGVIILPPDASVPPPPPPQCALGIGSGTTGSNGECSSSQSWSCGAMTFSVSCSCPEMQCTCDDGSGTSLLISGPIVGPVCPTCDVSGNIDLVAKLCQFPPP